MLGIYLLVDACHSDLLYLHFSSSFESPLDRVLVRVLDVPADGQAIGDTAHADAKWLDQFRKIEGRGFALDRRVCCDDDFPDHAGPQPLNEAVDPEVAGADAVQGRDSAQEGMVTAAEDAGLFEDKDIARLFHHADPGAVPSLIA